MKTVLITTDFKRLDKTAWPKFVKDFIENPDINSIHTLIGSKIAYHKFNTEAYPRLLFLEEKDDNGNIVYVVRKYFKCHEDYDDFENLSEREKLLKAKYSSLEEEEMKNLFLSFIKKQEKEPLPSSMFGYEGEREFVKETTYVFEMEEWCRHINNIEFTDDKKDIFDVIQRVILCKEDIYEEDNEGWRTVKFAENKEIIFRVHNDGTNTFYYLFDISLTLTVNKAVLKNKYNIDLSDERLSKQARKGYPDWILYSEFEDWKMLENDDEANLALSEEEIEVLNNTNYPYFINGLAGSGKSTILYYLFAHAYSYKKIKPMDLLFLSYSKKLITKARSVITALLRTNTSFHDYKLTEEELPILDNCFWAFQDFLVNNFLISHEESEYFEMSKHLSYEDFKTDYNLKCKLNEAKSYSAAMVWSVIRTFIKGRDYKFSFALEDYKNLHKNDKTVENSDYEKIYKIWKNWYIPTYEGKKWDDLDLVRYILNKIDSGFEPKKYDIIYCDEAQDFTPIENALILKLSKYTEYDLKGFSEIPIAYAGDPNQTVSPTGFNWKRLKEIADNIFTEYIGNHIKIKEKTLNNNYRSKKTIVEFANSIQYIRKCFLTDDVLRPQEQWNPQQNPLPGFFFLTTNDERESDVETIKKGFAKTECIITGADGEYECELVGNELTADSTKIDDKLLASIENKTKLYTAISSKGLEFKAVLLYRFADQLPRSFTSILAQEDIVNESDKYELAHFFTKLYIAVSRAKEVLYIADTQENYDRFWKYFIDNQFVQELLNGKQDIDKWTCKVGGIEIGDREEYLKRITENFNPLETAQKIFEDAKISENPKDMKRAVGYFEEAGDNYMSEISRAYVLLFEKDYHTSGEKFVKLEKKAEATKAFWQGRCWKDLLEYGESEIYKVIARFMTNKMSLNDFIKINDVENYFNAANDETWKSVVKQIDVKTKALIKNSEDVNLFALYAFLEKLVLRGFVSLNPTLADLYFKIKEYSKAISIWDQLAKQNKDNHYTENKFYYEAKECVSETTSERIFWMHKGAKNKELLKQYSRPKDIEIFNLDEVAKRIIFEVLLANNKIDEAYEYPLNMEYKLKHLYNSDRIQFIERYVLKDFTEAKFVTWIEQPVTVQNSDLFAREVSQTFYEKVFNLVNVSDLALFMKLKDSYGNSVMKGEINYNKVTDVLAKMLATSNKFSLASCFLDVVFNNPNYNYANANKFIDTIINVFKKNEISYKDFIAAYERNKYFVSVGLNAHDLDTIKDKLREFVNTKITSYKRYKKSDYGTIKDLCRIYEKVAPIAKEDNKILYNYETVLTFYTSLVKKLKGAEELVNFINIRKTILSARFNRNVKRISDIEMPKNTTICDILSACDREELVWFVGFVGGKKNVEKDLFFEWGGALVKYIYEYNISIKDIENPQIKENLRNNFVGLADEMIEEILSKDKINEIQIKLCANLYEVFCVDAKDKSSKYDYLAKHSRIKALSRLVEYFKRRALYFYSWVSENKFEAMQEEYELFISLKEIRKRVRPLIGEKTDNIEKTGIVDSPTTTKTKTKTPKKKPVDKAKETTLSIARNLLDMGMTIEQIMTATSLTEEEIEKL